jgi:hypothetical protein
LYRLLYVSQSSLDPCGPGPRDIVDVAAGRNAALGVTGALGFSGDHFAQVLEGTPEALGGLMASIRRDARHRILREWPGEAAVDQRLFPGWAMAYVYDERLERLVGDLVSGAAPMLQVDQLASQLFAKLDLYGGLTGVAQRGRT